MEKKKMLDIVKKAKKTTKLFILVLVLVLFVTVIIIVTSGSGEVTVDVESSLKEVFEISDLSTSEYTYNSIAEVKDEDNDKIKYYVAYKGTVKAGFDFEEIIITTEGKKTIITIPEIKIIDTKVEDDLDFIFIKENYDTSHVYAEASDACKTHIKQESLTNEELLETAKENAIETLKALTLPIEEQLEEGYSIEIVVAK